MQYTNVFGPYPYPLSKKFIFKKVFKSGKGGLGFVKNI